MIEAVTWLAGAGAALWAVVLLLPWRPWSTVEALEPGPAAAGSGGTNFADITVLIPARNEAALIGPTLAALKAQGAGFAVVVIDDQSDDGTAEAARDAGLDRLRVIAGKAPPAGWSGKLWALEQGRAHVETPLILLLDADIALAPGMLAALAAKQRRDRLALLSLMACLRMEGFWERLLMPAFVYFFKLLYPFRLANRPESRIAAAAGGCLLIERRALDRLGGFGAVRAALIDDCALARAVKRGGDRIWIGLTHGVHSRRPYPSLAAIWSMVARTAYSQLDHSPLLLLLCTAIMIAAFWGPVAGLAAPAGAAALGAAGYAAMALGYLPVLRFYRRPWPWALAMPAIGTLFLLMTWTSALNHWRGRGASWKGRAYRSRAGPPCRG